MYALSPGSGWMNDEIFHERFEHHFLEYAPSGRSLLLLLDGHSSDYNPTFICCAAQKGVMMYNLWYRRCLFRATNFANFVDFWNFHEICFTKNWRKFHHDTAKLQTEEKSTIFLSCRYRAWRFPNAYLHIATTPAISSITSRIARPIYISAASEVLISG